MLGRRPKELFEVMGTRTGADVAKLQPQPRKRTGSWRDAPIVVLADLASALGSPPAGAVGFGQPRAEPAMEAPAAEAPAAEAPAMEAPAMEAPAAEAPAAEAPVPDEIPTEDELPIADEVSAALADFASSIADAPTENLPAAEAPDTGSDRPRRRFVSLDPTPSSRRRVAAVPSSRRLQATPPTKPAPASPLHAPIPPNTVKESPSTWVGELAQWGSHTIHLRRDTLLVVLAILGVSLLLAFLFGQKLGETAPVEPGSRIHQVAPSLAVADRPSDPAAPGPLLAPLSTRPGTHPAAPRGQTRAG